MTPAAILYGALADPATMASLRPSEWNALIRVGRAERLLGSVAALAQEQALLPALPAGAQANLLEELEIVAHDQRRARWEIDRAGHALRPLGIPVVLMKGSAYLQAGLPPARGRRIGDLDVLVPRAALGDVEAALVRHGWSQAKKDAYDDHYYRTWMHELPPMVHGERGSVIDVHHTILPLTSRLTPDAKALIAGAVPSGDGLRVLGPAEMLLHAAAHLAYDGEFEGGSRNLWDIHQLVQHFAQREEFWDGLRAAASRHQLWRPLARALRLAKTLYGTEAPLDLIGHHDTVDWLALRKMRGRDRFGVQSATISDRLLYIRGHWLRMPPIMLARHLARKYAVRRRAVSGSRHRNDR